MINNNRNTDFLVVGAGIIGINIALELKRKYKDSAVIVLEKEKKPGMHASGRNSGVLHAGFYYTEDSMKARFCTQGNKALTEYCHEKSLPINRSGKLVVTNGYEQEVMLDELLSRAIINGVELFKIDEQEAREIEPKVVTYGSALFSPNTSTVSPAHVISSLVDDAIDAGIQILPNTRYISHKDNKIVTSSGIIYCGYFVNAAGLYADKIAMDYGFSKDYRIVPFKGLYLYADNNSPGVRTNIYPVPDLDYPFLGVHFTLDVNGKTKIGPTALPALWREQYSGFDNFNLMEMADIVRRDLSLFAHNNFGFREVAIRELVKSTRSQMVNIASRMVKGVSVKEFSKWGKTGIRAQLVNTRKNSLMMDFLYEQDDKSMHVLNAVSPAFTCSIPFAEHIVEAISDEVH